MAKATQSAYNDLSGLLTLNKAKAKAGEGNRKPDFLIKVDIPNGQWDKTIIGNAWKTKSDAHISIRLNRDALAKALASELTTSTKEA